MGIFTDVVAYNNQPYKSNLLYCQSTKTLFCDTTFPPLNDSLSRNSDVINLEDIEWKRASELSAEPKLFTAESPNAIFIGELACYGVLSALSMITNEKEQLHKLIPYQAEQEWNPAKPDNYAGIFVFCFWRYGEWLEVVVDDYLPTRNGKLISLHSNVDNEFWCALAEKAYAKINGSYEALLYVTDEEALVDLTGGIPQLIFDFSLYNRDNCRENLEKFEFLKKEKDNGSFIIALPQVSQKDVNGESPSAPMKAGYSITALKEISIKNTMLGSKYSRDKVFIIRLLHPSWSKELFDDDDADADDHDNAPGEAADEFKILSAADKMRIGLTYSNDGEFWITSAKFSKHFSSILIVRILNLSLVSLKQKWYLSFGNEFWYSSASSNEKAIEGNGGGGQFYFEINEEAGDTVMVHLLQKCIKVNQLPMSLLVYQVERNRHTILFSTKWANLVQEVHIDYTRSLSIQLQLNFGCYIIKPYIRKPPKKGDQLFYFLRLYSTSPINGRFLLSEPSKGVSCMSCFDDDIKLITRLRIVQASGLSVNINNGYHNAYCQVENEGNFLVSSVCKNSNVPKWEEAFLLYRKEPAKPIIIRVYNKCTFIDDFLGMVTYHFDSNFINKDPVLVTSPVKSKNPDKKINITGSLSVAFWHTDSHVNL